MSIFVIMSTDGLLSRVNQGLDDVRPYLESDGGDISLVNETSKISRCVEIYGAKIVGY